MHSFRWRLLKITFLIFQLYIFQEKIGLSHDIYINYKGLILEGLLFHSIKNIRWSTEEKGLNYPLEIGIDKSAFLQTSPPLSFFFSQTNVSMSGGVSNYNWAAIQSRYQLGNGEGIGTSHCPRGWHNGHRRGRLSRSVISRGGRERSPTNFSPFNRRFHAFVASGSHGGAAWTKFIFQCNDKGRSFQLLNDNYYTLKF